VDAVVIEEWGGSSRARYHVTSMMQLRRRLVPGGDPAQFVVVTAVPTGRGVRHGHLASA
jgi:hypothetical protein